MQSQNQRTHNQNQNQDRNNKHIRNKCNLLGHKGHDWVDCWQNPRNKSDASIRPEASIAHVTTTSVTEDRKPITSVREIATDRLTGKSRDTCPSRRNRSASNGSSSADSSSYDSRNQSASNNSSSADSSIYNDRSRSSEHFNVIAEDKSPSDTPTKGAEILMTLRATDSAPRRTFLALFDSGTASSLISYDKVHRNITSKVKSS